MEDDELIRSWRAAYGSRIKNLARRMLMDDSIAEDMLQETLLAAWKARDGFQGRSEVSTWLYRIALNRILRERERLRRGEEIARALETAFEAREPSRDPWDGTELSGPLRTLAEREIAAEIGERCQWYCSFLLTPGQRSVFLLREVLELEYAEIAAVLDVSVGVVRSRLKRARDRLHGHFRKRCSLVDPANPCRCEARIPHVLAKYPAILEKYRRDLPAGEIDRRLSLLDAGARERLSAIMARRRPGTPAHNGNTIPPTARP